jgi:hypothetical protein
MRKFTAGLAIVFSLLILAATAAEASHFRFGHVTWKRISGNTVEFTITAAWRADFVDGVFLQYGDGNFASMSSGTFTEIAVVAGQYRVLRRTVQHTYGSEGPFTAFFESCCRIGGLSNSGFNFRVEAAVDLRGGNQGSPVSSIPVVLQMVQGGTNTVPLAIADIDGDPFTCRMATAAESGLTNPAGLGVTNIAGQCALTWDTSGASIGQLYAAQIVIEENHPGGAGGSVALDFLISIVDGTLNQPPVCETPTPPTFQIPVGQAFSFTTTASDPDGDALTVSNLGLPSGATMSPAVGTSISEPASVVFNWTPQAADQGNAYSIGITYTDPGGLQTQCSFSISVLDNQPPNVNAGLDATVACAPSSGASVTLNGTASDPDGDTLTSIEWTEGATSIGSGLSPTVTLSPGTHILTLTVSDGTVSSSDDVSITVIEDVTDPVITVPAAVTVECTGAGQTVAIGTATATDDCPGVTVSSDAPATFALGTTTVT